MKDTEDNMLKAICQVILLRIQKKLKLDFGDHGQLRVLVQDLVEVVLLIKQDDVLMLSKYFNKLKTYF